MNIEVITGVATLANSAIDFMKTLMPGDLTSYQFFVDIFLPVILVKIGINKLSPPYKDIQILLNQVNAYYPNIYGVLRYRKNGILHIRFMNRKSLRLNRRYSDS